MTPLEKLKDIVRAEKAQIYVFYMEYSKTWDVSFEQKLDGQELKLECKHVDLDTAINDLYAKLHMVGHYGVHSVIPTLLEHEESLPKTPSIISQHALDDEVPF